MLSQSFLARPNFTQCSSHISWGWKSEIKVPAKEASFSGLLSWLIGGSHLTGHPHNLVFLCMETERGSSQASLLTKTLIPLDEGPTLITSSLLNSCKYNCTSDWNFSIWVFRDTNVQFIIHTSWTPWHYMKKSIAETITMIIWNISSDLFGFHIPPSSCNCPSKNSSLVQFLQD